MSHVMKAVSMDRTGGPEVLGINEVKRPEPGEGEVLIANRTAGLNFIDAIARKGELAPEMMPPMPLIPGVEGFGIIEAVGEGVTSLKPGDAVAWMGQLGAGGYGQYTVLDSRYAVPCPDGVSPEAAAALPVNYLTAYQMLFKTGRAEKGDTVLVHAAAGGVGTAALQLARWAGLSVIATCSPSKHDYVRELGAQTVLDYRREDLVEQIMAATDGKGVNLTLNPVSGATVANDLACLAPFGTCHLFGFLAGPPAGSLAESLAPHFGKSVGIRVSGIYTWYGQEPDSFRKAFEHIMDLAARGDLAPSIQEVLPVSRAGEAQELIESGKTMGKLVLSIDL
ncbi:MAG: zinc-binding alcohol dehydrogenase family protein [Acidobacteriota bacterium]|nr:zinc-binding alcohol dehydrogenase family protein [Acidobacteriota bacterium]